MIAHLNDIGTILRVTVYRCDGETVESNLGAASPIRILLRSPTGTVKTKTAVLTGDGSDGRMQYVTVDGDLDEIGQWRVEGYIELGSGKWHTVVGAFNVRAYLS